MGAGQNHQAYAVTKTAVDLPATGSAGEIVIDTRFAHRLAVFCRVTKADGTDIDTKPGLSGVLRFGMELPKTVDPVDPDDNYLWSLNTEDLPSDVFPDLTGTPSAYVFMFDAGVTRLSRYIGMTLSNADLHDYELQVYCDQ